MARQHAARMFRFDRFRRMGAIAGAAFFVVVAVAGIPIVSAHVTGACISGNDDDRCELWATAFDDDTITPPARSDQFVTSIQASDETVLATIKNVSLDPDQPFQATASWTILAYDAHSGVARWRMDERERTYLVPLHSALSPDGGTLFVSGASYDAFPVSATDSYMVTIAYDTANGARRWVARWDALPGGKDTPKGMAVSADGRELYVTGITTTSAGPHDLDYVVVAYDAGTGRQLWDVTHAGVATEGVDAPFDIAASPDGRLVFVTGQSDGYGEYDSDYLTLAITTRRGPRGKIAWVARYDGANALRSDRANAIAVSPDSSTVYVTGDSFRQDAAGEHYDMTTVAYGAETGEQLWEARTNGPRGGFATGDDLVATWWGVIVTGQTKGATDEDGYDITTAAYSAISGTPAWEHRHALPQRSERPSGLEVSPAGDRVYVTGSSTPIIPYTSLANQVVFGLDARSGTMAWSSLLDPGELGAQRGVDIAVASTGLVTVVGNVTRSQSPLEGPSSNRYDAATAAFSP